MKRKTGKNTNVISYSNLLNARGMKIKEENILSSYVEPGAIKKEINWGKIVIREEPRMKIFL